METRMNGKSIQMSECINDHRTQLYGIPAILWNTVNWQQPDWISHHIEITDKYVEEVFEVRRITDDGDEIEAMLMYERRVENGMLIEMLAPQHIFGLVDVKKYKETVWNDKFPTDTYFFGRNLIENWGKSEEIAEWIRKDF